MKQAFVLGIDGLPYTLARRLIDEGVMPNLGELSKSGTLAQMHTTVPDFSCVAWTSFATGVNPGKHGIYGFQDFHPKSGEMYMPDANDCRATPLWHEVGNAGERSMVFNLPATYPALPLRGKMVSGFIAPELDKACYPPTFAQTMRTLGYRMELDGQSGLGNAAHVEKNLWAVFDARKTAIRHLIQSEYWDLCIAVITETDRLQHYFLHALEDPNHKKHDWARKFYIELDKFIGEVAGLLDGKADLFLVSDHGFGVIKHEVVLQDLLVNLGLAPKSECPSWMDVEIAKKTKVFSLDPGRFYLNYKNGRFPGGTVGENEGAAILSEIEEALLELKDPENGKPIVSLVKKREQGFWGEEIGHAPDLIAATNPNYYFKSFRYVETDTVTDSHWEANHVWNDAIVYTPGKISENTQPVIWDVMPTVLAHMGIPCGDGVDGIDLQARS